MVKHVFECQRGAHHVACSSVHYTLGFACKHGEAGRECIHIVRCTHARMHVCVCVCVCGGGSLPENVKVRVKGTAIDCDGEGTAIDCEGHSHRLRCMLAQR